MSRRYLGIRTLGLGDANNDWELPAPLPISGDTSHHTNLPVEHSWCDGLEQQSCYETEALNNISSMEDTFVFPTDRKQQASSVSPDGDVQDAVAGIGLDDERMTNVSELKACLPTKRPYGVAVGNSHPTFYTQHQNNQRGPSVNDSNTQRMSLFPQENAMRNLTTNQNQNNTMTTSMNCGTAQQSQSFDPNFKQIPKEELYVFYAKPPRKATLTTTNYFTWSNKKIPRYLQWTTAIVCPITAEVFLSGLYPGAIGTHEDGFVWFPKKTHAEHAAAARALDILTFRSNGVATGISSESPMTHPEWTVASLKVPDDIRLSIAEKQKEIQIAQETPSLP